MRTSGQSDAARLRCALRRCGVLYRTCKRLCPGGYDSLERTLMGAPLTSFRRNYLPTYMGLNNYLYNCGVSLF